MRKIFLLRGAPASGKSTWIEKNKLEQYTLSTDKIRLMYQSPVLDLEGNLCITQKNDGAVWEYLYDMLEDRMIRGEFIVIDATHYKSSLLGSYKDLLDKYRYRVYVVDFTDVPKEELLKRNAQRDEYKRVPEFVIDKMCAVFEQDTEVSNRYKMLSKSEAEEMLNESLLFDYNEFEKVVVFGDIHGCYEPLKNYFTKNPFNKKYAYIFTGDYVDRGIQNKEVLEFLISIMDEDNVLMLEGNHENWIRMYCNDLESSIETSKDDIAVIKKYVKKKLIKREVLAKLNRNKIRSSVFIKQTIPQIKDIKRKDLRQLCRKFGQLAYITFKGNEYLICHGGIPTIPTIFTSTEELIKGVGLYENTSDIYDAFLKNTKENQFLIHAHRNILNHPIKTSDRTYNLCSGIEYGEPLRIIEISDTIKEIEEDNTVFVDRPATSKMTLKLDKASENEIINQLNKSKDILKKELNDDIVSYNFTRKVFQNRAWNDLTCKARGLFVDTQTDSIVARSYDKFFNIGEREETKIKNLEHKLEFPLTGYKKENGFLGIVSYNKRLDKPFIASKTTDEGAYADMVKDEVEKLDQTKLKAILLNNDITLLFEVINIDKDPHIIKYKKSELILIEGVYNKFDTEFVEPDKLFNIAVELGVKIKQPELMFNDWNSFVKWYMEEEQSFETKHEGWVFEDANKYMVKYKTQFYKFWKHMRTVKERMQANKPLKKTFVSTDEVKVYNLLKKIDTEALKGLSIIDIQDLYYSPEALLLYSIGTL